MAISSGKIKSPEMPPGLNTIIKRCIKNCIHEYQDSKFGFGMRAMNRAKEQKTFTACRCTVCGTKQ